MNRQLLIVIFTANILLACNGLREGSGDKSSINVGPPAETFVPDDSLPKTTVDPKPDPVGDEDGADNNNEEGPTEGAEDLLPPPPPPPGVTRPAPPVGAWDIPALETTAYESGMSLEDLSFLAKVQGFAAAQEVIAIRQAEEDYTLVHATAHGEDSESGTSISYGEARELDEHTDLLNAALARYSVVVSNAIDDVHQNYFSALKERHIIILEEKRSQYLQSILARAAANVALGDFPSSWLSQIETMVLDSAATLEASAAEHARISAELAAQVGLFEPIAIENPAAIPGYGLTDGEGNILPLPAYEDVVEAAVAGSLEIEELMIRRSASEHRIAKLDWDYDQLDEPTTDEQDFAYENARNNELLKIDGYDLEMWEADSRIRSEVLEAVTAMNAAATQYSVAAAALGSASHSYAQGIPLLENDENDVFDVIGLAQDIFDLYSDSIVAVFDFYKAEARLKRLLYEGIFAISLDPPVEP